jgi:WD40 repeat protein
MDKDAFIWDPKTGTQVGKPLKGHTKWITSLVWEPIHISKDGESRRLATASKDASVRIWDAPTGRALAILTSHTASVTSVRWGGQGLLFTGSEDRSIKVWDPTKGILCRTLEGHAHWVNHIALSTDHVMRNAPPNAKEAALTPRERYIKALGGEGKQERMVTASDDHTMYLWLPAESKKPILRMTGHVQVDFCSSSSSPSAPPLGWVPSSTCLSQLFRKKIPVSNHFPPCAPPTRPFSHSHTHLPRSATCAAHQPLKTPCLCFSSRSTM